MSFNICYVCLTAQLPLRFKWLRHLLTFLPFGAKHALPIVTFFCTLVIKKSCRSSLKRSERQDYRSVGGVLLDNLPATLNINATLGSCRHFAA